MSLLKSFFSLQLVSFKSFKTVNEALDSYNVISEGHLPKNLYKALKKQMDDTEAIAVGDLKLGSIIKVLKFFLCSVITKNLYLLLNYFIIFKLIS